MNMTGFVHPHQKKRHDEADSGPLETPDGQFKHVGQTLLRELRRSTTGCHASFLAKTDLPRVNVPLLPAEADSLPPSLAFLFWADRKKQERRP
jgi:hypothetical protein